MSNMEKRYRNKIIVDIIVILSQLQKGQSTVLLLVKLCTHVFVHHLFLPWRNTQDITLSGNLVDQPWGKENTKQQQM